MAENATVHDLEQTLQDMGELFRTAKPDCHGFIVIGTTRVFVVEEENPDTPEDFLFREIRMHNIQEFTVKAGEPDGKYQHEDRAEKVTDGGNIPQTTRIRLRMKNAALDLYVESDPRTVAAVLAEQTTPNE